MAPLFHLRIDSVSPLLRADGGEFEHQVDFYLLAFLFGSMIRESLLPLYLGYVIYDREHSLCTRSSEDRTGTVEMEPHKSSKLCSSAADSFDKTLKCY
jgi:hypothetical protein